MTKDEREEIEKVLQRIEEDGKIMRRVEKLLIILTIIIIISLCIMVYLCK